LGSFLNQALIYESWDNFMFYAPLSIKEAVQNVNETWFIPAIQRPYDWGERHKKEEFIFKLFDSVIREYPIGTLVIWETSKEIPYRRFHQDFDSEKLTTIEDKGKWALANKKLVYDGQQRLQSLYSCLRFTFHNQVLCYNLLFDLNNDKSPNGFSFVPKQSKQEPNLLRLNELYKCNRKEQAAFEELIVERLNSINPTPQKEEILRAKTNLKQLWKLFVDVDTKLLSYYPLERDLEEKEVLDIFKRINTTGMTLTKPEVVFSEIKRVQYDFEEQIWESNLRIKKLTNGFCYNPDFILQVINLIVKGAIRVDPDRISENELPTFVEVWKELRPSLTEFSQDFLYECFRITDQSIIGSDIAMVPIIIYFYYKRAINNYTFKDFSQISISALKKFLIYSQLLNWNLQGYIDEANRMIKKGCEDHSDFEFPFRKLKSIAKKRGRRSLELSADRDLDYEPMHWFVLKIITPNKAFSFERKKGERLGPEIDHIFPVNPYSSQVIPYDYYEWVAKVWNMQPVKGEINNLKRATPPKDFLTKYPIYINDYDCLPSKNLNDPIWEINSAHKFIKDRRGKIITWMNQEYCLTIKL
jgi:hypothetical protein